MSDPKIVAAKAHLRANVTRARNRHDVTSSAKAQESDDPDHRLPSCTPGTPYLGLR